MPKLYRVILPVSDISRGIEFYSALLGSAGRRVSSGRYYFDCEGVILCIYDSRADGDSFDQRPNPEPIYFSVPDLDGFYEHVRTLAAPDLNSIQTRPWRERSFYMNDPFGNRICFVDERTVFTGQFYVG
jgi:predicted enzyme related to lactoylglutathione lyase